MKTMKKIFAMVTLMAMLAVGVNTIFPPVDSPTASAVTVHPMASDPYDPVA